MSVELKLQRTLRRSERQENVVRRLVTEGVHNEATHRKITKKIEKLKIALANQQVIDSGSDKIADFQEAVTLGEAFIAE